MKKILPILILAFSFLSFIFGVFPVSVSAQITGATAPATNAQSIGTWVEDNEVTFAGKTAVRSLDLLKQTVSNYKWSYGLDKSNPFNGIWVMIRNIIYALLSLFVLAGAFVLIITRGQNLTVRKFIPRFLIVVLLVTLSFSLIQFIYQMADIIQGFFLVKPGGGVITANDLLHISFPYDFIGFRKFGPEFDESATVSLLLVKLTAATYYAMVLILILRKIILWFFIIVSPVFPLLILFYPLRNTAKIWVGEFFRWLLYAPLFAIFLAGLVAFWGNFQKVNPAGPGSNPIPLSGINYPCEPNSKTNVNGSSSYYPTSINILVGGPCQTLAFDNDPLKNNSVNIPESFLQYVVALVMLWGVILVPWILLKIFLDYLYSFSWGDNSIAKYLVNSASPLRNRYFGGREPVPGPPVRPGSPGVPPSGTTGRAMELPYFKESPMQVAEKNEQSANVFNSANVATSESVREMNRATNLANQTSQIQNQTQSSISSIANMPTFNSAATDSQSTSEILNLTNLSIPTIQDIAKYEAAIISTETNSQVEINNQAQVSKISESLNRLAGTSPITTPSEREIYTKVRERIERESVKGNKIASTILNAAVPQAVKAAIPDKNTVQQVNLDDYEEVKRTWLQNYRKLDAPAAPDGSPRNRKEWLKQEVAQISQVTSLMASNEPAKQEQAKAMVSKILPFLLLGGFSQSEIIAYLKAKQEAAKTVLADMPADGESEEDLVSIEKKKQEAPKTMTTEAEIPEDKKPEPLKNS